MADASAFVLFLGLVLLLYFAWFILRQAKRVSDTLAYPLPEDEPEEDKPWWYFDPFSINERLLGLKKQRQHKIRKAHLEEELLQFSQKNFKSKPTDKLKHIVEHHERKKGRKKRFHLSQILSKEIKVKSSPKQGPLNEIKRISAIEGLHGILRKKKSAKENKR